MPGLPGVRDCMSVRGPVRPPPGGHTRNADRGEAEPACRKADPVRVRAAGAHADGNVRWPFRARHASVVAPVAPSGPSRLRDGDARVHAFTAQAPVVCGARGRFAWLGNVAYRLRDGRSLRGYDPR